MDNLCHTLAGAALGEAGLKHKTALGVATLIIASNLPDIDVAVFATDTLAMSFRRGWTHGVLSMAVLPAVFIATTRNDQLMYVVLVAAIVAGLATTLLGAAGGEEHNYRLTVSPWFRSLFVLQPDITAMSQAGLAFQLHALIGMALFALWPFTRLVHAFTAPVHYLFRPYIVYRSRAAGTAGRPSRRGWERVDSR